MRENTNSSKVADVVLILLFVVSIWLFPLGYVFGWELCEYLDENRELAPYPGRGCESYSSWIEQFESFYKDHFGFRNVLIRGHSLVKHKWLKISSDGVIIGKDGWLFYRKDKLIEDYLGERLFAYYELAFLKNALEGKRAWLTAQGVRYLFVIAPNKQTVYPEFLPDHIRRKKGKTRLEQVTAYLRENSNVEFLDLRDALVREKGAEYLYYPVDTHWSVRGKAVAAREMCRRLHEWFPYVEPWGLDAFAFTQRPEWGTLPFFLGLKTWSLKKCESISPKVPLGAHPAELILPRGLHRPKLWRTRPKGAHVAVEKRGRRGRLLVFHDSFMSTAFDVEALLPLMENFGRTVFVRTDAGYRDLRLMVKQERPDVVIEQRVERCLFVPLSHAKWEAVMKSLTGTKSSQ